MHPDTPVLATVSCLVLLVPTMIAFLVLLRSTLPWLNASFPVAAIVWVALVAAQCVLAGSGFYETLPDEPYRFPLAVAPGLVAVLVFVALAWRGGRLDSSGLAPFAFFQVFRLPLEILVLHELYSAHLMPREITYEGFNFDIAMGISAILVGIYALRRGARPSVLLAWNVAGILFLINIMVFAILSLPTPFQRIALDQPNLAPMYFPFILLPAFYVPAALWGHLTSIAAIVQER